MSRHQANSAEEAVIHHEPTYSESELLCPSKTLLEECDINFIHASRKQYYQLRDRLEHDKAARVIERLADAQRRRWGEENVQYMRSVYDVATIRTIENRYDEAEALLHPLLELRTRVLGAEHLHTVNTMDLIADCHIHRGELDEAEAICKRCLAIRERQYGPQSVRVCLPLYSLGLLCRKKGKLELARDTLLKAARLEEEVGLIDCDVLAILMALARTYADLGDDDSAEEVWLRVIRGRLTGWGGMSSVHPLAIQTIEAVAEFWEKREQWAAAKDLWERVADARWENLGPAHELTLTAQVRLYTVVFESEDFQMASILVEEVLQQRMKNAGKSSSLINLSSLCDLIEGRLRLGICYTNCDRLEEGDSLVNEAISASEELENENSNFFLSLQCLGHYWVGRLRWDQGRMTEACAHRRTALDCCRRYPSPVARTTVNCLEGLANVLYELEEMQEVETLLREALPLSDASTGSNSRTTIDIARTLAYCLHYQQRYTEALALLKDRVIPVREKLLGLQDQGTLTPMRYAAMCEDRLKNYLEAEALYKRVIPGYETLGEGWHETIVFCVQNLLDILHHQDKLDEVENLLAEWAGKGVHFVPTNVEESQDKEEVAEEDASD
ncbi:MAG: hypothetical protein LQ352_004451 [Teloschistes flavicans]|nr:MAG: hypothetical protein LQ352_004451 [Teloschistes flavicans]